MNCDWCGKKDCTTALAHMIQLADLEDRYVLHCRTCRTHQRHGQVMAFVVEHQAHRIVGEWKIPQDGGGLAFLRERHGEDVGDMGDLQPFGRTTKYPW